MTTNKRHVFDRFADSAARFTGSSHAFIAATAIIVIWAVSGPAFHYSETWQLVINTGTTIITFLMVFLIQKAQNKDSKAIQLKLNELVAGSRGSNRMLNIEDLDENELDQLHQYFTKLAELAKKDLDVHISHSVEEAMKNHEKKRTEQSGEG